MSERFREPADEHVAKLLKTHETGYDLQTFCAAVGDLVDPDDATLAAYCARFAFKNVLSRDDPSELDEDRTDALVEMSGKIVAISAVEHSIDLIFEQSEEEIVGFFEQSGVPMSFPDIERGLLNHWLIAVTLMEAAGFQIAHSPVNTTPDAELNQKIGEARAWINFIKNKDELYTLGKELVLEPDLDKKSVLADLLKDRIVRFLKDHQITFQDIYGGHKELAWEQVSELRRLSIMDYAPNSVPPQTRRPGIKYAIQAVEDFEGKVQTFTFEKMLAEIQMPSPEEMEALRLRFGAKGANLLALRDIRAQIETMGLTYPLQYTFEVPDFYLIDTDVYRDWRAGREIDEQLREIFAKTEGRAVIVRSSAVYAEDGESLTGAGIYDSVCPQSRSFEAFKAAVIQVYESVDSPKALAYRSQNQVETEEMGVVVQEFVSPPGPYTGYINTVMPGIPELMEVTHYGRPWIHWNHPTPVTTRNIFKNQPFEKLLGHPSDTVYENGAFHYPPDNDRIPFDIALDTAMTAKILERLWGKPIQLEFVFGRSDGEQLRIVQVRPIPPSEIRRTEISFPVDQQPLYEGPSIGVGDMVLPVLANDNPGNLRGVVIEASNFAQSIAPMDWLPAQGAVIVATSEGNNGHIQTRCAERGLICVFSESVALPDGYTEMLKAPRLRIISNGLEGKVYLA